MPLTLEALPKPRVPVQERPPRRRRVRLVAVVLAACLAPVVWESCRVVAGLNLHQVIPGRFYRCAQPSASELRSVVRKHGIRTVINLRGCCTPNDWYQAEKQTASELGVAHHDIAMSSVGLPGVPEMRRLAEVLETCEYPVLVHCRRGADRTGLVSALGRLLLTDDTVSAARQQFSLRYGHFPIAETRVLHRVLDMYEQALWQRGQVHRPELLRQWLREDYKPGHRWASVEPLEFHTIWPKGKPAAARFRVTNRSDFAWLLSPRPNDGVHLMCLVKNADLTRAWYDGAGFYDGVVSPGESIELTLPLPAIHQPGRYSVIIDMADPDGGWFFLTGSPKFETEIEVAERDPAPIEVKKSAP